MMPCWHQDQVQWPITHYPSRSQLSFGPHQVQQSWPRETLSVLFHMVVEKPSSRRNVNLGKPGRHFINASQLIKKMKGVAHQFVQCQMASGFLSKVLKVLSFGFWLQKCLQEGVVHIAKEESRTESPSLLLHNVRLSGWPWDSVPLIRFRLVLILGVSFPKQRQLGRYTVSNSHSMFLSKRYTHIH